MLDIKKGGLQIPKFKRHSPILQAKFYYILPPLEGRFYAIDMKAEAILYDAQLWGNGNCLNYGRNEIMLYQFPTCGELKFHMQYRNVNPSPRRKRDW